MTGLEEGCFYSHEMRWGQKEELDQVEQKKGRHPDKMEAPRECGGSEGGPALGRQSYTRVKTEEAKRHNGPSW